MYSNNRKNNLLKFEQQVQQVNKNVTFAIDQSNFSK